MAIGKLFDISGDSIIPKQDCFIILPLKAVLDEHGEDGPKILAYLHYMKSMSPDDNPYADVPLADRSEQIMQDLGIFVDPEDPTIAAALQCVEDKYYTTFYGVYRGMKTMLDKLGSKLFTEDLDFSARDGNSAQVKSWIKEYEQLRKSLKAAYKDFQEDEGSVRVRGGGNLADDEEEDYDS